MIGTIYHRLPGPAPVRVFAMVLVAIVLLVLIIWSYEVLGDLLDSGGTVGA